MPSRSEHAFSGSVWNRLGVAGAIISFIALIGFAHSRAACRHAPPPKRLVTKVTSRVYTHLQRICGHCGAVFSGRRSGDCSTACGQAPPRKHHSLPPLTAEQRAGHRNRPALANGRRMTGCPLHRGTGVATDAECALTDRGKRARTVQCPFVQVPFHPGVTLARRHRAERAGRTASQKSPHARAGADSARQDGHPAIC